MPTRLGIEGRGSRGARGVSQGRTPVSTCNEKRYMKHFTEKYDRGGVLLVGYCGI